MAVQRLTNYLVYCLNADTKPTGMATNALAYVQDTGDMYRYNGSSWVLATDGPATTSTQTNKTINASNNTITDTSTATGDLLVSNGTKFVRRAKGTGLQVLRTNSGATDLEWASLNSENTGKATASGNGSSTTFNIAHSIGSNPTVAMVQCASHSTSFTYTTDATNIAVTFTSAPPSGTNNVIFYWRAVA